MLQTDIITIIGAIVVLAFIILAIFIGIKNNKTKFDKKKADEFLQGLSDTFYKKMMSIVINFDVTEYSSIQEFEEETLSCIYNELWDYVSEELLELSQADIISAVVVKILNKEYVEAFIKKLVEEYNIVERLNSIWEDNKNNEIVEEDKKLQEMFSDQSQYVEESKAEDLIPVQVEEPSKEDIKSLIPAVDDEKEYDPETDSSVETINEEETFVDSRGRLRSKKTGRYV